MDTTTTPRSTIMDRLRTETAALHQAAESRILQQRMVDGSLSKDAYVRWLGQRMLIHQALDQALAELAGRDSRAAGVIHERQFQTEHARRELAALGGHEAPGTLRATRSLTEEVVSTARHNPIALLGMHYVLEGSKNGGRFLAARVRGAYGLAANEPIYLDPHGVEQRRLWGEFKAAMNAAGFSAAEEDAIVAAAKAMFRGVAAVDDEVAAGMAQGSAAPAV